MSTPRAPEKRSKSVGKPLTTEQVAMTIVQAYRDEVTDHVRYLFRNSAPRITADVLIAGETFEHVARRKMRMGRKP